jgi:hypothetical protein
MLFVLTYMRWFVIDKINLFKYCDRPLFIDIIHIVKFDVLCQCIVLVTF